MSNICKVDGAIRKIFTKAVDREYCKIQQITLDDTKRKDQ